MQTVGVEPIPPEATTESLTARLESLTAQACTFGWITRARLCTILRDHLTARPPRLVSVRRALAAAHKSGGPVTDNAYWLLKVNADYILSLPSSRP